MSYLDRELEEFANDKMDLLIEQPSGWREKLNELERDFYGTAVTDFEDTDP